MILLAVFLLAVPPGCASQPAGRESEAVAIANEWFTAMKAGDSDRAWTRMHPVTQSDIYNGSKADFAGDVKAAQWDDFEWVVHGPRFNDVQYLVDLELPNGWASMPGFLFDRGLVPASRVNGELVPYLVIRIDAPVGGAGILSNGFAEPPVVTDID